MVGVDSLDGRDAQSEILLGYDRNKGIAIGGNAARAGLARLALVSSASFKTPGGILKNGARFVQWSPVAPMIAQGYARLR